MKFRAQRVKNGPGHAFPRSRVLRSYLNMGGRPMSFRILSISSACRRVTPAFTHSSASRRRSGAMSLDLSTCIFRPRRGRAFRSSSVMVVSFQRLRSHTGGEEKRPLVLSAFPLAGRVDRCIWETGLCVTGVSCATHRPAAQGCPASGTGRDKGKGTPEWVPGCRGLPYGMGTR